MRSTTRPSRRTTIVGMLYAWNRVAVAGFSSTLTFTTLRRPAKSPTSCSSTGATNRQGPHHGAHRSTRTATAERASTSNVASVASTSQGRALPHEPQWGAPRSLGRIRFFLPHDRQVSVDTGNPGSGRGSLAGVVGSVVIDHHR